MNNRKYVIAGVVAVLFLFAGYNLYSYFKTQQAIQLEQDQQAENRRVKRETERKRKSQELEAQRIADSEAEERARLAKEAREAAEAQQRADVKMKAEADAELRRAEAEKAKSAERAKRLGEKTKSARTLTRVPEIRSEILRELSKLSPRYVLDKPEEFLGTTFGPSNLSSRSDRRFMIHDGTDTLMLFSIIAQDIKVLEALIEIGMDVNAVNEGGFTPLMFAAAYAYPETAQFLIDQGADINAQAYVMDLNPLHMAALKNPNPAMIEVFLDAGMSVEHPVLNGYTPLQLAASDNTNLEVVEVLIERGADIGVYDEDGKTVKSIVQGRVNGSGDRYSRISAEVDARVLKKLDP